MDKKIFTQHGLGHEANFLAKSAQLIREKCDYLKDKIKDFRDLGAGPALNGELQHLAFAAAEGFQRVAEIRRASFIQIMQTLAEIGAPGCGGMDGIDQLRAGRFLEHVARSAGVDGAQDIGAVGMHAHDQQP